MAHRFVAVGSAGTGQYSADGITWTGASRPSASYAAGVAQGNGVFVAVGNGVSSVSPSGEDGTWINYSVAGITGLVSISRPIVFDGSKFVVVVYNTRKVFHSTDGISWSEYATALPITANWRYLVWNGTGFVAIAVSAATAAYSSDGITWTQSDLPVSGSWTVLVAKPSGGIICAIRPGDTDCLATSADHGASWTLRSMPVNVSWKCAAWNGTVFCCLHSTQGSYTSTDGITWSAAGNLPVASTNWDLIAWNGDVFCALATDDNTLAATSPTGATWTQRTSVNNTTMTAITAGVATLPLSATSNADALGAGAVTLIGDSEGFSETAATAATDTTTIWHPDGESSCSSLSDALVNILWLVSGISNASLFGDSINFVASIMEAVSEAQLNGVGAASQVSFYHIAESAAGLTSTASAPTILAVVVASEAQINTAAGGLRGIDAIATGMTAIEGAVEGQASYHIVVESLARLLSAASFVQAFWDGWATNINTGATSRYENFRFNSFARIGTGYYGCDDAGIHLLSGELDGLNDIQAIATTAESLLPTEYIKGDVLKTIPNVYVAARSDQTIIVACAADSINYEYETRPRSDVISTARVDVGKGVRGTFWRFEIRNKNGADMELQSLSALVRYTKKNRRV